MAFSHYTSTTFIPSGELWNQVIGTKEIGNKTVDELAIELGQEVYGPTYGVQEIEEDPFASTAIPLVRSVYPRMVATELVSVQPMAAPTGMVNVNVIL